ncbi:MAG: hypothetical protein M1832_001476 [Thelocarpon impressellum]|nr:MAG: hypothetical protein M1832_001476 [Thelocarpon impressellum]
MILLPRDYYYSNYRCNSYYDRYDDCYSPFYAWGRWVVLAVVIVVFFLLFFVCSGLSPYNGTGWLAGKTPPGHGPAQYNMHAQPQAYPGPPGGGAAPPYSPQPAAGYYGGQQVPPQQGGFSGQQQNGVELTQPPSTYQPARGGDPVYSPPVGAPPGKDGVIR